MSPRSHSERLARAAVPIGPRPRQSAGGTSAQRKGYIVARRASEKETGREDAEGRPLIPAAAAAATAAGAATCRGLTHLGAGTSRPRGPRLRRPGPQLRRRRPPAARVPRSRSQPLHRRSPRSLANCRALSEAIFNGHIGYRG